MDGSSVNIGTGGSSMAMPIRVEFGRLTVHRRLIRDAEDERRLRSDPVLRVLVGVGRGSVLQGTDLPPMVLLPLRGNVRITDGESVRILKAGQMFVNDAGQDLHAVGRGPALWLAVVAPGPVWRELFEVMAETPIQEPALFPALHPASRAMRRAGIRLAREARRGPITLGDVAAAPTFADVARRSAGCIRADDRPLPRADAGTATRRISPPAARLQPHRINEQANTGPCRVRACGELFAVPLCAHVCARLRRNAAFGPYGTAAAACLPAAQ